MVGTLFHQSHLDLSKWFKAIFLIHQADQKVSIRQLAKAIPVTNKTASSMIKKIEHERGKNPELLKKIAEFYLKNNQKTEP